MAHAPMICPKHHAIAQNREYGWPLCVVCFREARAHADDEALEQKIRDLRYHSTSALLDRLKWPR